jgi:hypothetical protein
MASIAVIRINIIGEGDEDENDPSDWSRAVGDSRLLFRRAKTPRLVEDRYRQHTNRSYTSYKLDIVVKLLVIHYQSLVFLSFSF